MKPYNRFYFNWFIAVIWILIIVWMTFAYIYQWGNNPIDTAGYVIFLIIFIGTFLAVYGFHIKIDDEKIYFKIGIGLQRRIIYFSYIKEINVIENKYKYSPTKSGLKDFRSYQFPTLTKKGIEVKLKDNRTGIIIGTRNIPELLEELKKRIKHN